MSAVDDAVSVRVNQAVQALVNAHYEAVRDVVPVDGPVVVVYHDGARVPLRTSGRQWKFGLIIVAESDEELVDGVRRMLGSP